mmetsp:Transcript_3191/g.6116  ORF Transcript_3191/g.6116 Transcript_3191/m.6116 type:complete len:652 (+) Transcript_3191:35-1990(+)
MRPANRLALVSEHALELVLTFLVAAGLVGVFRALVERIRPKHPTSSKDEGDANTNTQLRYSPGSLLAEYGRAWCLHQLIPFIDELLLGSYGQALDNRMIAPLDANGWSADWIVRLPLVVVAFLFPSPAVLFAAHFANVLSWATWMPAVWDHMVWAVLLEITFLLACVFEFIRCFCSLRRKKSAGDEDRLAERFITAARAQLVVLYFSAAFWKLTTSWYATYTSCAPVLLSELLSAIFDRQLLQPGSDVANALLGIAPVFVAGLEFAVALALMLVPEAGVLLALLFHQTINLMPMTYAGGFSISMCCRFVLFLPGGITASFMNKQFSSKQYLVPSAIVSAVLAAMIAIHKGIDTAGAAFLALTFLYLRTIFSGASKITRHPRGSVLLTSLAVGLGILYGFGTPILGLQAMASSTMYGNLKQFGGGNHLLVPTGLLQDYFATPQGQANGPAWAVDAFGGGMVRVDSTNSSVMQQLTPADATAQLPEMARELLVGIGASARYFELYAARNFYGRSEDLNASALHNRKEGSSSARLDDPPYAQPAYEMRRVLALAREKGEAFDLIYTKLPNYGIPSTYIAYQGVQVHLIEDPANGVQECYYYSSQVAEVDGAAPESCADDEIALLPPPPRWLLWILHPYPIPLLQGDGREVHCST